ncbi:hypothetical protein NLG97_g7260 [Lecanicillium saksenae]|uniref:Uncharacterized protein n=1 Tax=Lecanicillium saksenae TaxID=468837 RepID=A0ACC1QNG8_9HYPO|nr:hypothetical protein NLG97_g7260 [Lecanicillium saksenae]
MALEGEVDPDEIELDEVAILEEEDEVEEAEEVLARVEDVESQDVVVLLSVGDVADDVEVIVDNITTEAVSVAFEKEACE